MSKARAICACKIALPWAAMRALISAATSRPATLASGAGWVRPRVKAGRKPLVGPPHPGPLAAPP